MARNKRKNLYTREVISANQRAVKKKKINKDRFIWSLSITFIVLYMSFNLVKFMTTEEITYITATNGSINTTTKVQGVITRDERVYYSNNEGYIKYLFVEGEKIPAKSKIAIISNEYYGDIINNKIEQVDNEIKSNSDIASNISYSDSYIKANAEIISLLHNYVTNKNSSNFNESYTINNIINKLLSERYESYVVQNNKLIQKMINEKEGYEEQLLSTSQYLISENSGIICYSYDGYEDLLYNNMSKDILKQYENDLVKISINPQKISKDMPVYKLINSQEWYISLFVDDDFKYELQDTIEIVINDGDKLAGTIIDIKTIDDIQIVTLKLNQLVHEYIDKRIVTVTIDNTSIEGIKLPNSSIIQEELIAIPRHYIMQSKGLYGVIRRTPEGDSFVQTDFVYSDEDNYYILKNNTIISIGDIILPNKSSDSTAVEHVIKQTKTLEGVYIINKGYKEFKTIERLYETDEYSIIANNTAYGVRLYDRVLVENNKEKRTKE